MDKDIQLEKQPWEKPELIILLRGHPEEAVLAACKGASGTSASGNHNGTCQSNGGLGSCGTCNAVAPS